MNKYDTQGRLTRRTDPDGRQIAYTYDAAGNRTSMDIPSGATNYTFDELNRLETVTDANGGVTTYFYNDNSNLIRTEFPNGTVETRQYDILNRLTYIETKDINGDIISSFLYELDIEGNRTQVTEHDDRIVKYYYDDLDRLEKEEIFDPGATTATRTIEYAYDAVGNRLSRVDSGEGTTIYTYDNNDRLSTETTDGVETTYTYDDNGNTITKTTGDETVTYQWDAENRLVGADTDGDGTVDVTNQYDADGVRVAQTVNGEETRFLIDTNRPYAQVLEEYTDGGIIKVSYVYGNDLISQERDGEQSFYHVDGLGSTRALSDSTGNASDIYIYDAFGQVLNKSGTTENSYLYAGEQRDSNLGLDYLRARYLDVNTGRFFSRDTFEGFPQNPITLNKYIYGNANPIINIDPSGQFSIGATLAGLSVQATLSQIFTIVYLPVLLKGGATLATVGLMKPGFDLRNLGLSLIASDKFELGFDLYIKSGQIIAEAPKFLATANAIIDYGLAVNGAIGLFTNPAKIAGVLRTTSISQTTRTTQIVQTIVVEADDLLRVLQEINDPFNRNRSLAII